MNGSGRRAWLAAALTMLTTGAVAGGLFSSKPEPRALITMFGVMVEARNILTGAPQDYQPNQTNAAQLFPDRLTVTAKDGKLAALAVSMKRYGGFMPGNGGDVVSVYFIRLGKDGGAKATAADVIESNWVFKNHAYALGVQPGTYAVAAVVVDGIKDVGKRGLYFHQAFWLDEKSVKASTVTVGPGEIGVAGEVTFKSQKATEPVETRDTAWKESWKPKGHVRNLRSLSGKFLIYRARIAEEVGFDGATMVKNFDAAGDDTQKRNRALLAVDSAFPLPGLPDDLEVDAEKKTKDDFKDDFEFDLKDGPWGEPKPAK